MKNLIKRILPFKKIDRQQAQLEPPPPVVVPPQLPVSPIPINQTLEEKIQADSRVRVKEAEKSEPETESTQPALADKVTGYSEFGLSRDTAIIVAVKKEISSVEQPLSKHEQPFLETEPIGKLAIEKDDAKPEPQPSLLSNFQFIKLVEECADLMKEFDGYADRITTEDGKIIAQLVLQRLQEVLERSGLSRISDEETFSILRHTPVPMSPVADGTPIAETLSSGLAIENRIFRKAKVKTNVSQH